jgi:hypothetical protein
VVNQQIRIEIRGLIRERGTWGCRRTARNHFARGK